MTPLAALLCERILTHGPLTFADFMAACLTHPRYGYYRQGQRIGQKGDFITAPEISQIFGELIGLWMVDGWEKLGCPSRFLVVELGPGRGILMQDALRAAALRPAFLKAVEIHLVEINTDLIQIQKDHLASTPLPLSQFHWHDSVECLPASIPLIWIANEFFDALPVRILKATAQGWQERHVDWDETKERFIPIDAPPDPPFCLQSPPLVEPAVIEQSPVAWKILGTILQKAAIKGGYGLIIDYGYTHPPSYETLEAIRSHRHVDPFTMPGQTDLSAHVDFAALSRQAQQDMALVYGPVTQQEFLIRLGLIERTHSLYKTANAKQKKTLDLAIHRLMNPKKMGTLFQAMAVSTPHLPPPEGFDSSPRPESLSDV